MFMNADTPGRLFGYVEDDISLVMLPLFHVFGHGQRAERRACASARTMALIPRFDAGQGHGGHPARPGHRLRRACPTMFIAVLNHPDRDKYDLSSMRVAVSGGAPIPAEVIDEWERTFPGVVILEGYGLSETCSTTTFNVSEEERRVYSVGKPIYGVEVRDLGHRVHPAAARQASTSASSSSAGST